MSSARKNIITRLRIWRQSLAPDAGLDRIYLVGSLVDKGGVRFTPEKSDVDLLMCFSGAVRTGSERATAQRLLLPKLVVLEKALRRILPRDSAIPVVSVALVTELELTQNIHKDDRPDFWESTFVDLAATDLTPTTLVQVKAERFKRAWPHAVQVLRDVQKFRNQYLHVSSNGVRSTILPVDSDSLPKPICRSAASLRYFMEWKGDRTGDPNIGYAFLLKTLEEAAEIDSALDFLKNRVLARANRGSKDALEFDELLLLWEVLADKAVQAIENSEQAARSAPAWRPPLRPSASIDPSEPRDEEEFLTLAAKPSLRFGSVNLACKLTAVRSNSK
jgi:hypothetical protein